MSKPGAAAPAAEASSASPQEPLGPLSITDVDPDSLKLKLQFKPWVAYGEHLGSDSGPPGSSEKPSRPPPKGAVPEQDIVLPLVPLALTPAAAAAAAAAAEAAAAAAAAAEAAEEAAAA